jgi:hypothetical protein
MRVILSVEKLEYLKNIADFRRKKQRNFEAVRIDVRVKISWHPHLSYPPLSTLKRPGLSPSPAPFGI